MIEVARQRVGEATITAVQGDLTAMEVDAVVNAANERLAHGGGVAAAIARAGGPVVQQESDAWVAEHGPIEPGGAAVTSAGNMPARWVIHTVGPRYRDGQDNEGMLRAAVAAVFTAAAEIGASSLAFPAISAGIFGYPRAEATRVVADEVAAHLRAEGNEVRAVALVGYDAPAAGDFAAALEQVA